MEQAKIEETFGAGRRGVIRCSYDSLVLAFGEPHYGPTADGKVQVQWAFKYEDQIITIYDYKEEYPVTKVTDWHIGGKNWPDNYEGIRQVTEVLRDYGREVEVIS